MDKWFKYVFLLLVLYKSIPCSGQFSTWQKDSLRVDSIYDLAAQNSNIHPKIAEAHLEHLIAFIDDTLLSRHLDNKYLLQKKGTSKHFLAYFKRRDGKYDESLRLLQESIALKEVLNDTTSIAESWRQIGKLWMYQKRFEKGKEALEEAYKMGKRYNSTSTLLDIYTSFGNLYSHLEDWEIAEGYHKRALFLADSLQNKSRIAASNANYGGYLREQARFSEAIPYLERSIQLHKETNNKIALESGVFALSLTYRGLGKYTKALKYGEESLKLTRELQNDGLIYSRYNQLALCYKNLGDFEKAFQNYLTAVKFRDSLQDIQRFQRSLEIESQFKLEKQRALDSLAFEQEKIRVQEAITQKSRLKFSITVGGLLAILAFVSIGYLLYKQRALKAEQLAQAKVLENTALNQSVESKKEEISQLLTESMRQLRDKEILTTRLNQLFKEEEGVTLGGILADLKSSKLDDQKLLLVRENIEKVNFQFIKKLKEMHSNLTKTDIEICSFIKIGLSRSEVADLRNTSLEAVKSTRFRLKKKLDLGAEIPLDEYIKKI